jgi:hypothetical protein
MPSELSRSDPTAVAAGDQIRAEACPPARESSVSEQIHLLNTLRARRDAALTLKEIGELSLAIEEEMQALASLQRVLVRS